jgi:hypothetical protein
MARAQPRSIIDVARQFEHELVHHLQYLNKVTSACPGDAEYQAIEPQISWLREHGLRDPLGLLDIDSLTILMLRQCGD